MFDNNKKITRQELYNSLESYTAKYSHEELKTTVKQLAQLVSMLCDELGYNASFDNHSTVRLTKKTNK